VDPALYWTIWIALALFAAGEAGKRGWATGGATARWAWPASATGVTIAIAHVIIAMGARHGWSHDAALAATARQTRAVYGVDWGGGLFVNYAFVSVWIVELWLWRRAPAGHVSRPDAVTWLVRGFFFVVIVNAAIVFAGGLRRIAGAIIVLSLVVSWWPRGRTKERGALRR
jgi:hypothetical protein